MENNTVKNNTNTARKQTFSGVVVSDKMKDTAVVVVERYVKDREFKKFTIIRKRYKVHDIGNTKKIGDKATIESCKPISKDKSFKIIA